MVGGTLDSNNVELYDGKSTDFALKYPITVQKSIGGTSDGKHLFCGGIHHSTGIVKECYQWKNNEWTPSGMLITDRDNNNNI